MTQQMVLQISPREVTGKATKRLRKSGIIPANISGHKEESQAVQVEALAFEALRRANCPGAMPNAADPKVNVFLLSPLTLIRLAAQTVATRLTIKIPRDFGSLLRVFIFPPCLFPESLASRLH